mgnify:CR=1 FL=1
MAWSTGSHPSGRDPTLNICCGEARLQFAINSSEIRMDLANNKAEMGQMLDKLKQIVGDTLATLNSVSIMGMSSVDGSYAEQIPQPSVVPPARIRPSFNESGTATVSR